MQGTPQRPGTGEEGESELLKGLGGLTAHLRQMTMDKQRAAQLGRRYGLDEVIRWKPQRVCMHAYFAFFIRNVRGRTNNQWKRMGLMECVLSWITGHGSYSIGVPGRYTASFICRCWGGGVAEGGAGREWGGEGEDLESIGVAAGSCAVLIFF